ncbi:MAG: TonB-dependent receptor [Gemmatimonadetes bacterium]|nr:TonB-dependent receptor [Gemmatimonadota bacterium]
MRLSNGVGWLPVAMALLATGNLAAQTTATVSGRVTNEGGGPLSGVQVVVTNQTTGTQNGALTQDNGRYVVAGLRAGGPYQVEAQMIGYGPQTQSGVTLAAGQTRTIDFQLTTKAVPLDALEVFATRAVERKTPVAYSNVNRVQIQNELGSQDLPMVLNMTPSVYATMQGGGAGDARINIRGFDQRHIGVMVDGVPVNDMENGWVYWSDFDGLGDAATSIQVQRGFSAVNLAVPSIGGTMNIITDPSSRTAGASYKQEFGNDHFYKETFLVNTGEHDGFAFTGSFSRKTGNGLFDAPGGGRATWTNAYAWYIASAYQINSKNRLEFYAMNEPQSHGQNLYELNIAQISHSYARKLGYSAAALAAIPESGRLWSPNVDGVSPSYTGKQYASSGPEAGTFSRHSPNFINERENYFDKPQVNLNYYSYFGNGLTWSTVAYYSGGSGGGSGTLGSLQWNYSSMQRVADWNATIAANQANADGHSSGILRNSVNNQWTIGAISKLRKEYRSGWTSEIGLDWRTASIDHYREVRDLLGGQYWIDNADAFTGTRRTTFGDKIDYYNTNTVNWLGAYVQGEKVTRRGSFYGMFGWDQNAYTYKDHFNPGPGGGDLTLKSGNLHGYQVKGGLSRNFTEEWSAYANAGYVSKVPIFDGVIDDVNGTVLPNPKNETFTSFEAGLKYRAMNRGLALDLNLYDTTWKNHAHVFYVPNQDISAQILGVDERHLGVELQGAYQPIDLLRFDVAASLGDWKYLNDASGRAVSGNRTTATTYNFYIKGLKVSDQPQTQLSYAVALTPTSGVWLQLQGRSNFNYYAAFDPFGRTTETDHAQAWKTPGYTVFDLHGTYRINDLIPAWTGGDVRLFANVFNLFNTMYVQDATDNSSYNAYYSCTPNYQACAADPGHNAMAAEVFLGLPRTYNVGFQVIF